MLLASQYVYFVSEFVSVNVLVRVCSYMFHETNKNKNK